MIIYFIFFLWILLFVIFPKMQNNIFARNALFVCLGLFLCTSYMAGSDWRNYEYDFVNGFSLNRDDKTMESGYIFITQILSSIGVDFWHFFILTKVFCYYTIIKFIQKYTNGHFAWALLIFYAYFSLFYFIDCPFRNLISASIFLYAIDALIDKRWSHFLVITVFASSIHLATLLFVPFALLFYFLKKKPVDTKYIPFIFVGLYLFFYLFVGVSLLQTLQVLLASSLGEFKNLHYLLQIGKTISVGLIILCFFFVFMINYIDKGLLNTRVVLILYHFSILFLLFKIVSYFIPMVGRLSMFVSLPFVCVLSLGIFIVVKNRKKIINIAILMLFVLYLANLMHKNITKDYRFIPYSSYLQYFGNNKPSYSERCNYNWVNSPYKDKTSWKQDFHDE